MKREKVKINVKDHVEDNVVDLSLLGKRNQNRRRVRLFWRTNFVCFGSSAEIETIPVRDIAAVRRVTVLDLSSNNIKYLPVRNILHFEQFWKKNNLINVFRKTSGHSSIWLASI